MQRYLIDELPEDEPNGAINHKKRKSDDAQLEEDAAPAARLQAEEDMKFEKQKVFALR
jgi:hypothetical protein